MLAVGRLDRCRGPDPFLALSDGRTCFRVDDLAGLVRLLDEPDGRCQGCSAGQCRRHDGPRPIDRYRPRGQDRLEFDGVRRNGRNRRALTGRTLDAGTEGWTAFAERFTALCTELGVFEADRICFVSDGAASIRWIRERAFPGAIELLDWYHLADALRAAIGADRPDRIETALAVAAPGDADRLCDRRHRRRPVGNVRVKRPHRDRKEHAHPAVQGPRHELVPAGRVGLRPAASPAGQPDVGPLLGWPVRSSAPPMALASLSQHRRRDASCSGATMPCTRTPMPCPTGRSRRAAPSSIRAISPRSGTRRCAGSARRVSR